VTPAPDPKRVRFAFTPAERRALLVLAVLLIVGLIARQLTRRAERDESPVVLSGVERIEAPSPPDGSSSPRAVASGGVAAAPSGVPSTVVDVGPEQGGETGMVAGLEADTLRKVDINRAGLEELESLPGIGPVLARRILEFRETNGPFRRSRDLLLVRGIGEKRMARLEPYITLTP